MNYWNRIAKAITNSKEKDKSYRHFVDTIKAPSTANNKKHKGNLEFPRSYFFFSSRGHLPSSEPLIAQNICTDLDVFKNGFNPCKLLVVRTFKLPLVHTVFKPCSGSIYYVLMNTAAHSGKHVLIHSTSFWYRVTVLTCSLHWKLQLCSECRYLGLNARFSKLR